MGSYLGIKIYIDHPLDVAFIHSFIYFPDIDAG